MNNTVRVEVSTELDLLLWEHYGSAVSPSAALAAVLAANIGLAAYGPTVPAGTTVVLPDIEPERPAGTSLWT